jgi:hypothetical protein
MPEYGLATGAAAIVAGTAPECLAVRQIPWRSAATLVCLQDGATARVTNGPEFGEGEAWLE